MFERHLFRHSSALVALTILTHGLALLGCGTDDADYVPANDIDTSNDNAERTAFHESELVRKNGIRFKPHHTIMVHSEAPSHTPAWDTHEPGVDHIPYHFEEAGIFSLCHHPDSSSEHKFELVHDVTGKVVATTAPDQSCEDVEVRAGYYTLRISHPAIHNEDALHKPSHLFIMPVPNDNPEGTKSDSASVSDSPSKSAYRKRRSGLGTIRTYPTWISEGECKGCNLQGLELYNFNINGVNFSGANMERINARWTTFQSCTFDGANLTMADFGNGTIDSKSTFKKTILSRANFTGADLRSANFSEAVSTGKRAIVNLHQLWRSELNKDLKQQMQGTAFGGGAGDGYPCNAMVHNPYVPTSTPAPRRINVANSHLPFALFSPTALAQVDPNPLRAPPSAGEAWGQESRCTQDIPGMWRLYTNDYVDQNDHTQKIFAFKDGETIPIENNGCKRLVTDNRDLLSNAYDDNPLNDRPYFQEEEVDCVQCPTIYIKGSEAKGRSFWYNYLGEPLKTYIPSPNVRGGWNLKPFKWNIAPGADLSNSYWAYTGANFKGVTFDSVNLSGADFSGLNMKNAHFKSTNICGEGACTTNFYCADLSGATGLSNRTFFFEPRPDADNPGRSGNADIGKQKPLKSGDWRCVNLSNTTLNKTKWINADLTSAKLTHAQMGRSKWTHVSLAHANMQQALADEAHFVWVNMDNVQAEKTTTANSSASMQGASFKHISFQNAQFAYAHFDRVRMDAIQQGAAFKGAGFQNTSFNNANLSSVDLTGIDLTGAFLTGANLAWATLKNSILYQATLINAYLCGAILDATNLKAAVLNQVYAPWETTTPKKGQKWADGQTIPCEGVKKYFPSKPDQIEGYCDSDPDSKCSVMNSNSDTQCPNGDYPQNGNQYCTADQWKILEPEDPPCCSVKAATDANGNFVFVPEGGETCTQDSDCVSWQCYQVDEDGSTNSLTECTSNAPCKCEAGCPKKYKHGAECLSDCTCASQVCKMDSKKADYGTCL